MYIALYEFKVHAGLEEQFEKNWHIVTEAIYRHRGSLGSRLHKSSDGIYIAYAQWPSEKQYNADIPLSNDIMPFHKLMKDACENISTLRTMTVTDDLLKD